MPNRNEALRGAESSSVGLIDAERRRVIVGMLALPAVVSACTEASAAPVIRVHLGPSCGCCREWVRHLEANGFTVETFEGGNNEARARLGMPVQYGSCHTGEIEGYAIEGHVPASEILRLIDERPQAVGIAVPGMPIGSPGMDGPAYGGRVDPYDVLLVRHDGSAEVYRAYR